MLCCERNPDWNGSNRSLEARWAVIWEKTKRSRVFDRKGRLEIGLKFDIMSGSSPGFLRIGDMTASLSD